MKIHYSLPLLLALTLLIAACDKEKDEPATSQGFLQIEDQKYDLTSGAMIYIEEVFHSDDPSLKYTIDLILHTQDISVEGAEQSVNFSGQGQQIGIAFATTRKTDLDEGSFDLNDSNIQHVGYYSDWKEERDANDQNPYCTLTTAEISISKTGEVYQIALTGTDEQNNSIALQYKGILPYFSLE